MPHVYSSQRRDDIESTIQSYKESSYHRSAFREQVLNIEYYHILKAEDPNFQFNNFTDYQIAATHKFIDALSEEEKMSRTPYTLVNDLMRDAISNPKRYLVKEEGTDIYTLREDYTQDYWRLGEGILGEDFQWGYNELVESIEQYNGDLSQVFRHFEEGNGNYPERNLYTLSIIDSEITSFVDRSQFTADFNISTLTLDEKMRGLQSMEDNKELHEIDVDGAWQREILKTQLDDIYSNFTSNIGISFDQLERLRTMMTKYGSDYDFQDWIATENYSYNREIGPFHCLKAKNFSVAANRIRGNKEKEEYIKTEVYLQTVAKTYALFEGAGFKTDAKCNDSQTFEQMMIEAANIGKTMSTDNICEVLEGYSLHYIEKAQVYNLKEKKNLILAESLLIDGLEKILNKSEIDLNSKCTKFNNITIQELIENRIDGLEKAYTFLDNLKKPVEVNLLDKNRKACYFNLEDIITPGFPCDAQIIIDALIEASGIQKDLAGNIIAQIPADKFYRALYGRGNKTLDCLINITTPADSPKGTYKIVLTKGNQTLTMKPTKVDIEMIQLLLNKLKMKN